MTPFAPRQDVTKARLYGEAQHDAEAELAADIERTCYGPAQHDTSDRFGDFEKPERERTAGRGPRAGGADATGARRQSGT